MWQVESTLVGSWETVKLTDAGVEEEPVRPSHSVFNLLEFLEVHLQLLLAADAGSRRHLDPLEVHVYLRLGL